MEEHMKILRIIKRIRESLKDSVKVYTQGNCVQFAVILKEIYPQGTIMWNEDHAIFELNSRYYDVTGEVSKTNHMPLIEYGVLKISDLIKNKAY